MIWVRRPCVIRGMARIAVSVDKLVVVVDVALHTLGSNVGARQCEFGGVVVKRRGFPRRGRVALCACLRISEHSVIGIRRARVVRSMTIHTRCRKAGVLVVLVTVLARNRAMCSCQSKLRRAVIKCGRRPNSR
jgi:hypothetical protein